MYTNGNVPSGSPELHRSVVTWSMAMVYVPMTIVFVVFFNPYYTGLLSVTGSWQDLAVAPSVTMPSDWSQVYNTPISRDTTQLIFHHLGAGSGVVNTAAHTERVSPAVPGTLSPVYIHPEKGRPPLRLHLHHKVDRARCDPIMKDVAAQLGVDLELNGEHHPDRIVDKCPYAKRGWQAFLLDVEPLLALRDHQRVPTPIRVAPVLHGTGLHREAELHWHEPTYWGPGEHRALDIQRTCNEQEAIPPTAVERHILPKGSDHHWILYHEHTRTTCEYRVRPVTDFGAASTWSPVAMVRRDKPVVG